MAWPRSASSSRPGTSDTVSDRQDPNTAISRTRSRLLLQLAVIWFLAANLFESSLVASSADGLLSGAVLRAKLIQSGRLEYQLEVGVVGGNIPLISQAPVKSLAFAGSNWIERNRDSAAILINYPRCSMRYDEVRQANGTLNRTATISPPLMLRDAGRQFRRPWFAGTFWLARQAEYVEQHRAQFRLTQADNIDGIPCEVCESSISGQDAVSAFDVHSPLLAAGAMLRIHIAPHLGFVLTLIELKSTKGDNVLIYQSKHWLEFPNQVYFPRLTRMELRGPAGETEHEQFNITAELINQPIPESEFVIKLPAGTRIRDARDTAHVTRFDLTRDSTSVELVGRDADQHASPTFTATRWNAYGLWVLGGVLVIGIVFTLLVIRHMRMRSRRSN